MSDDELREALSRAHDALDAEHGHTLDTWRDRQRLRSELNGQPPAERPTQSKAYRLDARAVGRRIKQRRNELGLSQRDASFEGGSYAYLSRLESGNRTPSLGMLVTLSEKLHTSALWLATGDRLGFCPVCLRGGQRWVIELDDDFSIDVALDGASAEIAELVERSARANGVPLKRVD